MRLNLTSPWLITVSYTHLVNGCAYRFTVSGGIIAYPEEAHSWVELEKGACAALRQAKENGKNQCVEFTAGLLDELQLSHCLAQSADNGFQGFRLVFPVSYTHLSQSQSTSGGSVKVYAGTSNESGAVSAFGLRDFGRRL